MLRLLLTGLRGLRATFAAAPTQQCGSALAAQPTGGAPALAAHAAAAAATPTAAPTLATFGPTLATFGPAAPSSTAAATAAAATAAATITIGAAARPKAVCRGREVLYKLRPRDRQRLGPKEEGAPVRVL